MLSKSTKYALRALLCLAHHPPEILVRVDQLSEQARVPGPYLSKLIKILAEKGIVETRRGLTGGVKLTRKKELSFFDVCKALEDPIVNQECFISNAACNKGLPCAFHGRWGAIREETMKFLQDSKVK